MAKKEKVLLQNASGAGMYVNSDEVDKYLKAFPGYKRATEAKAIESAPENKAVKKPAARKSE